MFRLLLAAVLLTAQAALTAYHQQQQQQVLLGADATRHRPPSTRHTSISQHCLSYTYTLTAAADPRGRQGIHPPSRAGGAQA